MSLESWRLRQASAVGGVKAPHFKPGTAFVTGRRGQGVGGSDLTETHGAPLTRPSSINVHAQILHAVHALLDLLMKLDELYKKVQQRVDGVQS